MSTVFYRNSFVFAERPLPREVAFLVSDSRGGPLRRVTWSEVMAERRAAQARILARRRGAGAATRAVRVSVRYFDQEFYGGWQCYLDGVGFSQWVRHESRDLMQLFPLAAKWHDWKAAFAHAYARGTFDGHPRGVAHCWAEVWHGHVHRVLPPPSDSLRALRVSTPAASVTLSEK